MENKTLSQLRALARAAGLRGYADLSKKQLIGLLKKRKAPLAAKSKKPRVVKKKIQKTVRQTASRKKAPVTRAPKLPTAPMPTVTVPDITIEEQIEIAKYETALRGVAFASSTLSTLHEDIDRLPPPRESVLCLLPQKPGVVHAYWVLQPGTATDRLRLRLCRAGDQGIDIVEELKISGERGHWYFLVGEAEEPSDFLAQLGYYNASGAFTTAIRRGVARIPSLYVSAQIDRRWWISDDDFQSMYLRAGGRTRGARLFWPGSFSSRGAVQINPAPSSSSLPR